MAERRTQEHPGASRPPGPACSVGIPPASPAAKEPSRAPALEAKVDLLTNVVAQLLAQLSVPQQDAAWAKATWCL